MSREPKPRAKGYNAAYRMKLEEEFMVAGRMHRLPRWMKESVSLMLREIENLRASARGKA